MMAHFREEDPCITVTESHFDFFCENFFKPMITSRKMAKIEKKKFA